ncbi:MAG: MBL fold metallo-hydrolase [Defluviitaleaceae bacterium]|nr:MBL fold metallo-hydrolase [Defluviitaleaceae bacterium]
MAGSIRNRKSDKKQQRNLGRPFGFTMVFVLLFALVYTFVFPNTSGFAPGDNEIIVAFLDVGQGDSILIWSRDNAVLIDGGEFRQRDVVMGYIRRAGISRLDYVIATHPHSDHIGGLVGVLGQVEVGQVLMPDVVHTTATFENFISIIENNQISVASPEVGERFQAGIIEFIVLAPQPVAGNLNDASLVVRMQHGETSFIFTGDAEAASERAMVVSGLDLNSDVLKVGHHGSRTSTTAAFLDAVSPRAAVISVGANNQFGHPHADVMTRLYERGIVVYRTDDMGTIMMATNGEKIVLVQSME